MKEKHGLSKTRIYRIWRLMKRRCYNQNSENYHRYGGRGIKVCDEWRNSFMNFYNWSMSNGYNDNLTLDRKDNDADYMPSNCRWATFKDQENNRGNFNIKITYDGKTQTLMQWAEELGIPFQTLRYRVVESKWPVEDAFMIGVGKIYMHPNGNPPKQNDLNKERRQMKYHENHDSREEYIEKQSKKTEKSKNALLCILKENPDISNRKAAKILGVSESYVRKLKKVLHNGK